MRGRVLLATAVVVIASAAAAWWLLDRQSSGARDDGGLAVPGLAARVEAIDRIEVVGAGDASLVMLEKRDGLWRMPARLDWPANQREIGNALYRLGGARRVEAKTADPTRHSRLGVEDVTAPTAKGTELHLSGGGEPVVLVIGNNHPALGGSYVRLGDDPQAWLIDEDVAPVREPAAWLDRRLVDLPMARIERIRVTPAQGATFVLAREEDKFTPDGVSPSEMSNGDDGNATAGVLDQLAFEDVAADGDATAELRAATQTAVFETVDGLRITAAAWPGERGTWARFAVALDEDEARAWFERAATAPIADSTAAAAATDADADADIEADIEAEADEEIAADTDTDATAAGDPIDIDARVEDLRRQVGEWEQRFKGHRFLLPAYKSEHLMKSRTDYLEGTP